jgi:hypothetical protein
MNLAKFRESVKDERAVWQEVLALRGRFTENLALEAEKDFGRREEADRSIEAADACVREVLVGLEECGLVFDAVEAGHGIGHLFRDYLNAHVLLEPGRVYFAGQFAGFVAGALHDIGCAFVPRYRESSTPLRHAEVGGLLLDTMLREGSFGLSEAERLLIVWAVMAHTHYLKPQSISWAGETVVIPPYPDTRSDGSPIHAVWLARRIDRLDCGGAHSFPARHYLTLVETHKDFSPSAGFYEVEFANHLRPVVRSDAEIKSDGGKLTMLEHLARFARCQTSDSPYGKHDPPTMVTLRDGARARLEHFVEQVRRVSVTPTSANRAGILNSWTKHLGEVIEPSVSGRRAAEILRERFTHLDDRTQSHWCIGFGLAMFEYALWGLDMIALMKERKLDPKFPFLGNSFDVLFPASLWE